jgi:hypothetical protein
MADNIISQYFVKNDGSQIGNDAQLINGVYQNEKIVNKNSGEKFVKSSSYRNVFEKVDETILKIDDANANGVCSCKNATGVEVDTFKCHVPVSNSAPTLKWGETITVGTVDGKPLTITLPPNPNTTYSAGEGLVLNGTEFSISQDLLDKINNNSYKPRMTTIFIENSPLGGGTSPKPEVGQIYTNDQFYSVDSQNHLTRISGVATEKWKCIKQASEGVKYYTESGQTGHRLVLENSVGNVQSIFEFVEYID